jgi:uncharacterized protein (TIGR02145 family)
MKIFNKINKNSTSFNLLIAFALVSLLLAASACKKQNTAEIILPQYDSIVDIDKNIYKIVKIGNQWWMAENLRVKTYNDSTPIVNASSDEAWKIASAGAYCLYKNDDNAPGLLYNWYAVSNSKGIAPKGWHVATESDWQQLENYLGMSTVESNTIGWRGNDIANKLKAYGKSKWLADEAHWPTNQSGFNAEAGSCRRNNANWGDPGLSQTGFWWTATADVGNKAFYRYMDYQNNHVFRHSELNYCGMSIRCVKD